MTLTPIFSFVTIQYYIEIKHQFAKKIVRCADILTFNSECTGCRPSSNTQNLGCDLESNMRRSLNFKWQFYLWILYLNFIFDRELCSNVLKEALLFLLWWKHEQKSSKCLRTKFVLRGAKNVREQICYKQIKKCYRRNKICSRIKVT